MMKKKQPFRYFLGIHSKHGGWVAVKAKSAEDLDPSEYSSVDGPYDTMEEAQNEIHDRGANETGFGSQQVFDILMGMISHDPSVKLASYHIDVAAYQAIVGWGSQRESRRKVVKMLVGELRRDDYHTKGAIWHVIAALDKIEGEDAVEIPEDDRGRVAAIRELWMAWADRNGY